MPTDHLMRQLLGGVLLLALFGCTQQSGADPVAGSLTGPGGSGGEVGPQETSSSEEKAVSESPADADTEQIVLAGGCFWCVEAAYEQLRGVSDVVPGYAGGTAETANYKAVCTGLTGHAEAVRITYDPTVIEAQTLLKVFFLAAHDPTQANGQFPDIGPQYRSAVFYADQKQKEMAEDLIRELDASGNFQKPIATTVEPLEKFYVAEDYHHDYAKNNPGDRYVLVNSLPKAAKVCRNFPELIRDIVPSDALKDQQPR
jgi:methionine-S-sulfoxide reductase